MVQWCMPKEIPNENQIINGTLLSVFLALCRASQGDHLNFQLLFPFSLQREMAEAGWQGRTLPPNKGIPATYWEGQGGGEAGTVKAPLSTGHSRGVAHHDFIGFCEENGGHMSCSIWRCPVYEGMSSMSPVEGWNPKKGDQGPQSCSSMSPGSWRLESRHTGPL